MHVGFVIYNRRRELGIKQGDLARLVGTSPAAICKIEHGDRTPRKPLMDRISKVLGLKYDDFVDDTNIDNLDDLAVLSMLEKRVDDAIEELETTRTIIRKMIAREKDD